MRRIRAESVLSVVRRVSFALPIGVLVGLACEPANEEQPSTEEALCQRYDECNFLRAGQSLRDCTDSIGICTGDFVSSERVDWQASVEDCLQLANCDNFYECTAEIDDCTLEDDGGPSALQCGDPVCLNDWCDSPDECTLEWDGDGECDCGCFFEDSDCN